MNRTILDTPLYVVTDEGRYGWELRNAVDERVICRFDREHDAIAAARSAAGRAYGGRVMVRYRGRERLLPIERASDEELADVEISQPQR